MTRQLALFGSAVCLVLSAGAASAVDLPIRKAGLWEVKMVRTGSPLPNMTMQHCTDETTDKAMSGSLSPMSKDICSKNELQKTATGYTTDSVCAVGGTSVTSHSETSGDFNSAYTVTTVSHSEGGPAGARDTTSKIEAKWIGACKPDQKPGDVVTQDGRKMNIIELQKRQVPATTR